MTEVQAPTNKEPSHRIRGEPFPKVIGYNTDLRRYQRKHDHNGFRDHRHTRGPAPSAAEPAPA